MAGPPPTPTAILALRGSWRAKTRLEAGEPMPDKSTLVPAPPSRLNRQAKAVWREVATMLHNCGVLTNADLSLLERYCVATADYRELRKDIDKNGLLDLEGNPRRVCWQQNKLNAELLKLERELGMTPASRPNIRATKPEGNAEEADFD